MSSIAFANGVDPQGTWDDPKNAGLKKKREHPDILMPGDKLFLKKGGEKHDGKPEAPNDHDEWHVPSVFKLHFFVAGKPLAFRGFVLSATQTPPGAKGAPYRVPGVTDANGLATFHLHPIITECTFQFFKPDFEVKLLVGHLHPVDESGGVEQRLNNLGYVCELPPSSPTPTKDQKAAHEARRQAALKRFQQDIGVSVTGQGGQDDLRKHTEQAPKPKK